jgi:large subunit ribosomal protein L10
LARKRLPRIKVFLLAVCGKTTDFFMESKKEEKKKIIEDLEEKISKQKLVVFFDFTGIKSKDLFELRRELKKSGNELKIAKKNLAQIAFKNSGFEIDFKKIKAQLALVFGFSDEVLPAKIVYKFSQKIPSLKILGGIFQKEIIGPERILDLAKLPTREELLRNLLNSISAPISNFVTVLRSIPQSLVFVLSQIQLKVKR